MYHICCQGWEELLDEESGEKVYFNTLTNTIKRRAIWRSEHNDLFTSIYDITYSLGLLCLLGTRYLNDRAAAFVEDLEIIENNYEIESPWKEYFQKISNYFQVLTTNGVLQYVFMWPGTFWEYNKCPNEDYMKKVAIMRKGDVRTDQWMPYVKPKKKYRPNTRLLKATEKHTKMNL